MANTVSVDKQKIEDSVRADNTLHTSIKTDLSIDFSTGMAGAGFSVYGIARGSGNQGSWGVHDIVGVHGTAVKNGKFWAAGMHCDVYDTAPGGTAIGLNIEFPQTQPGTSTIGVNIQPHSGAKDLVGLQIQNPEAFKYSLYAPNMNIVFGKVDDALFGMRFNKDTQALEFYRNIGQAHELRVHEIKMDFSQVK